MQLIMTATDRGRGTKGRKASSRLDREKVMPKGERPTSNPRPSRKERREEVRYREPSRERGGEPDQNMRIWTSGVVSRSRCVGQNSVAQPMSVLVTLWRTLARSVRRKDRKRKGDALLGFRQYETMHSSW